MKLAILGGTFNPVHLGHVFLAHEIRHDLGYDTVVFVPTNLPAHKGPVAGASPQERLHMLGMAVDGQEGCIVDDCELRRGGVSYTIDTVRHVLSSYALEAKPGLVIGDDLVPDFGTWHRAGELAELVDIIVVHRLYDSRVSFTLPHTYCDNLRLPISSSGVRERIAEGRPVEGLIFHEVAQYVRERGLYGPEEEDRSARQQSLNAPAGSGYSPRHAAGPVDDGT